MLQLIEMNLHGLTLNQSLHAWFEISTCFSDCVFTTLPYLYDYVKQHLSVFIISMTQGLLTSRLTLYNNFDLPSRIRFIRLNVK